MPRRGPRAGRPGSAGAGGGGGWGGRSREQMTGFVVEAFRECAAHGELHGVMIGYQNHDELLKTADEVLALRERVGSPWFGLNVDVGSLRSVDPYEEIARLGPYACTWPIKERAD